MMVVLRMHGVTLLQATIKEPAISNMRKGITMAYTLISSTYFTVAISGYWAFGQNCLPYLLNNLSTPTWPITIANIAAIIQITGCYQVSFYLTIHCMPQSTVHYYMSDACHMIKLHTLSRCQAYSVNCNPHIVTKVCQTE